MKLTGWKIASVIVLLLAIGIRLYALSSQPPEPETPSKSKQGQQAVGEPSQQASDLLSRIDEARERMNSSGKRFGVAVREAMQVEGEANGAALQQAWELAVTSIRKSRDSIRSGGTPTFASGQQLASAYVKYLDWQEETYREDYAALITDLQRADSTPLERQNMVKAVFFERSSDEKERDQKINELREAVQQVARGESEPVVAP